MWGAGRSREVKKLEQLLICVVFQMIQSLATRNARGVIGTPCEGDARELDPKS